MNVEFGVTKKSFNVIFQEKQTDFPTSMNPSGSGVVGEDGATFIPSVSDDGVISWTNDKGLPNPDPVNIKGRDGKDGIDGKNGVDGKDGYTPRKGVDYFDGKDGLNGKDGTNGKDGYTPVKGVDYFDGKDGKDGINGKDGYTPIKGVDYFDGKNGTDGKDGSDGYTPIKGTDYYTEADKAEFVQSVISALPVYNGEVVSV